MAAFQFPDPALETTVTNPITGSTYQWKEPPGKWVVTVKMRDVGDIIWEGDNPPSPIGDYKLWYSTDTLELYFYYCDAGGTCAWVPTSVPIQVLEDLNAFAAQAEVDIDQLQYKQQLLQNAVDQIYLDLMTGASARPPIFSDTEPTVHPDFTAPNNGLETGDTWFDNTDPEQLIEYVYDGTQWIVTGNYVKKKGGDTMEGQLIINGPRKAGDDVDNPDLVSSLKVLNIDNAQNSALQLRHSGNAKVYIGDTDVSIASDIKFNRSQPSVVRTNVQELLEISDQEIAYLGRSIEDEDLITKKYVDDIETTLQNGIIELEEEINAIAPSVERGQFISTTYSNAPRDGEFMLSTLAGKTIDYGDPGIVLIQISKVDNEGVAHTYADVEEGQLLQLFEDGNSDYGLYLIEAVAGQDDAAMTAVTFTVSPVSGFGEATEGDLARLKIFSASSGGTADGFVLKTGDTMTGELEFYHEQSGNSSNYNTPSQGRKDIRFTTKNTDNGVVSLAQLYQPGYSNTLVCSGGLVAKSNLYTNSYLYGLTTNSNGTAVAHNPRIYLRRSTNSSGSVTSEYGSLQWGSSDRLNWYSTGGSIRHGGTISLEWTSAGISKLLGYNGQGSNGQVLRLNSSLKPYWSDPPMPTYTITKSNGNYYVS